MPDMSRAWANTAVHPGNKGGTALSGCARFRGREAPSLHVSARTIDRNVIWTGASAPKKICSSPSDDGRTPNQDSGGNV